MPLGFCSSREPQQRHLFWTHHYLRCQAADRRQDEDHGEPDRKNFVQQHRFASLVSCGNQTTGLFSKVPPPTRDAIARAMAASSSQITPLFSQTLNTLTLCRVPNTRENLGEGEVALAAKVP